MKVRVVILESAQRDLESLKSYIVKNFSLDIWKNTYAELKEALRNLRDFPDAGHIPEELEKLGLTQYKQLVSGLNRIIYELRQETIYVHVISDSRRDMSALLTRRLLRVI